MYSIFIPHAGKMYAGDARKKAFESVHTSIKYIIFIAALHDSYRLSEDKLYLLYKDADFPMITDELTKSSFSEHSYEWIREEIEEYFPSSKKLVIAPTKNEEKFIEYGKKIAEFILRTKNTLLIGTSDLLHYGKKFGNESTLKYPYQQSKINLEENIIQNIVENRYSKIDDEVLCGPYSTKMFCYINNYLGIGKGTVVDYYDSSVYNLKGIDRYVINPSIDPKEFVSYLSVVYGSYNKKSIDNNLSLGFVKSILLRDLYNKNYELNLPSWSIFSEMRNGVFVSTFLKGKTNSCYGSFEDFSGIVKRSSSENMKSAAEGCVRDSIERWRNPITKNNIDSLRIEIDILDERRAWKLLHNFEKEFIMNGSYGVYLKLGNGGSATYLPSVARDYKEEWSKIDYIENLSRKAGGRKDEWRGKGTKIYTYKITTISSSIVK